MSEDNAAKPTKTVRCRLFRGRFNKGWTETTDAVIRSGLFAKPFGKVSTRNDVIWRGYSRDGHFRVRQARVPFGGTVLASVAGEQPRGPQFVRITQLLRLPARQRCQPGFRFQRDRRLAERPLCARSGRSIAHHKRIHRCQVFLRRSITPDLILLRERTTCPFQ